MSTALLSLVELALRAATWPTRRVWETFRSRPKITLTVGEADWIAPTPHLEDHPVTAIIIQIAVGNGSPNSNSVSTFKLTVAGQQMFPAEVHDGQRGGPVLVSGNKASAAPSYRDWLNLPVELAPFGSASGRLGFIPADLSVGQVLHAEAALTAIMASGDDKSATLPRCNLKPPDTP